MKRKISCFLIILLIMTLLSDIVTYAAVPTVDTGLFAKRLKSMEMIAENSELELYLDRSNTEIAVKEKSSGYTWFSNLADRQSIQDPTARTALGAHINIVYYDGSGTRLLMDTLQNSVVHNRFKIKKIKNGVRIEYTLKNNVDVQVGSKLTIPKYKGKKNMNIEIVEDRGDSWGFMESNTTTYDIYNIGKEELIKLLQDQVFFIPVEYRIDGKSFLATIPCDEIKHPKNYPLSDIILLQFFGAAHYTSKGYMFIPDGSGALINIAKNVNSSLTYKQLYGPDYANLPIEKMVWQEPGIMPVFGLKNGDNAFLAIIEDGDSFASVTAQLANFNYDYCTVYASFNVMPVGTITLSGAATPIRTSVYQKRMYKGDIRIRYSFLDGEDADYVGMAKLYREYLVDRYNLKKIDAPDNLPLNLEILGAIKKMKSVLGFPMKLTESLTTFEQAERMVEELQKNGLKNIKVRYTGWFNGGINHSMPTSIKPDRALGGKSGFKKFLSAMKNKNVKVYPDVVFQKVYDGNVFNFIKSRDSVRTLAQKIIRIFPFSFVDYSRDFNGDSFWIMNPRSLERVVGKFLKSYEKYENKALSLRDLGTDLSSDFDKEDVIDRQQAKEYAEKEIKRLKDAGFDLMLTGANMYAIPYASTVLNAPVDSSHYNLISETIPFFQISMHGYVDYTGEPVNLAQDYETTILRSIETGASPYYSLMYNDCSVVKNTDFTNLYSTNYKDWKDDLLAVYKKLNSVLKDVQDKVIVDHEKLADGVYKTTYENGKAIIVNYNKEAVEVEGKRIEGRNYFVIEGVEVE